MLDTSPGVNPNSLVSKSHQAYNSWNSNSEIVLARPFAEYGECVLERVVVAGSRPEAPTTPVPENTAAPKKTAASKPAKL